MGVGDSSLPLMPSLNVHSTTRGIVPQCKPLLKGETMMIRKLRTGKLSAGSLFIVQALANLCDYNA